MAKRTQKPNKQKSVASVIIGDDTIPPIMSADVASKFSLSTDQKGTEDVINYLAGQARDENVIHAEKIKSEKILGRRHDVWDVTTDKERWWVISNPMNLYAQRLFPSLDYTLSFHVGLMARIAARNENNAKKHDSFVKAWRKLDQAVDACDMADEPEDCQAVGMRCREALLAFVKEQVSNRKNENSEDLPKSGDFKGWIEILINEWLPGSSSKELRSYLKNLSYSVWQLVNWLTHASNANNYDALTSLLATENVMGSLTLAVKRHYDGVPKRCEVCGSYKISTHFIAAELAYQPYCPACGWEGDLIDAE